MSTINMQVEPLVRAAFQAAVRRDPDASIRTLQAIALQGDKTSTDCINLATAVAAMALLDIHDGEAPDGEQIRDLGRQFAASDSDWSGISEEVARVFLAAISGESDRELLDPNRFVQAAFVVGAWLLSSFGPDDFEPWWTTLDKILVRLQQS